MNYLFRLQLLCKMYQETNTLWNFIGNILCWNDVTALMLRRRKDCKCEVNITLKIVIDIARYKCIAL